MEEASAVALTWAGEAEKKLPPAALGRSFPIIRTVFLITFEVHRT